MNIDIEIHDNSGKVLQEFKAAARRAMERCGMQAEGYAKDLCPVDTGAMRGAIAHKVEGGLTAYVGVNKKYAPYVEFGTGIYYSGGRKTRWSYKDTEGNWHMTNGQAAKPFIKPSVADHVQTYKNIINDEMRNG